MGQAGFIAMEDLNVKGMMADRRLAKSIGDVGMHELKRQIEDKTRWYGREFMQVDRWAPIRKTCSECGIVPDAMPLQGREWRCPDCKAAHDRAINAAKNILMLATGGALRQAQEESHARGGVHKAEAVV